MELYKIGFEWLEELHGNPIRTIMYSIGFMLVLACIFFISHWYVKWEMTKKR